MYSKHSSLILGFHGCDIVVRDTILSDIKTSLEGSKNNHDWLGHGIYFWENDPERALEFATKTSKRPNSKITTPSVIGAILDLGYCLDLSKIENNKLVKESYKNLVQIYEATGLTLPANRNPAKSKSNFPLIRDLDCAVIQMLHTEQDKIKRFDSVRGLFPEDKPLYKGSGFRSKNHIQLCIRNPNCIKGYFLPRDLDKKWDKP